MSTYAAIESIVVAVMAICGPVTRVSAGPIYFGPRPILCLAQFLAEDPKERSRKRKTVKAKISVGRSSIRLTYDGGTALQVKKPDMKAAVPLLRARAPFVGTGMEFITARDSGAVVVARGVWDGVSRGSKQASSEASGDRDAGAGTAPEPDQAEPRPPSGFARRPPRSPDTNRSSSAVAWDR